MRIFLIIFALGIGTVTARADQLVLFAGGGNLETNVPATQAKLIDPFAIDADKDGNFYIAEMRGERILRVDPKGELTIIAGTGKKGNTGDAGPAFKATFNSIHHVTVGPDGFLYIADTFNNRIRKLDPKTGLITAFAGTGKKADYPAQGDAMQAGFGGIYSLAFSADGSKLFAVDLDSRRILAIDPKTSRYTVVAGNGKKGVPQNRELAVSAPLVDPRAVTVDRKGNIYILERAGNALRVVDPQGKIRTLDPFSKLNGPKHLCVDLDDNIILADTANHVVGRYRPADQQWVRIAGSGKKGISGNGGSALEVDLNEPHGVYVHPSGTIYIVDSYNNRVFRLAK